jgi:hypothetical protein
VSGHLYVRAQPSGRRQLHLTIGPFAVEVTEVQGRSLTEREWQDVLLARRSYTAMWGDAGAALLANDPLDGRDCPLYDSRHYIAWIRDEASQGKLVTMRKVRLVASVLTGSQRADPFALLPSDIQFWAVDAGSRRSVRLWDLLRAHGRRLAPDDDLAELRIAAIGRMGTFPCSEPERTPRHRERTAIAFAAIQMLAAHRDSNLLWTTMLCRELPDRVLGVADAAGACVAPAFTPTEEALGLPPGSVRLDNSQPAVREHKTTFPGYWVDNDAAARLVEGLMNEGQLASVDLRSAIAEAIGHARLAGRETRWLEEAASTMAGAKLAEAVTRPRVFQHVMPRLASTMRSSRMSAPEFADLLIARAGDGPFSSTVMPAEWAASARAVLRAAEAKYGDATPLTRPVRSPAAR